MLPRAYRGRYHIIISASRVNCRVTPMRASGRCLRVMFLRTLAGETCAGSIWRGVGEKAADRAAYHISTYSKAGRHGAMRRPACPSVCGFWGASFPQLVGGELQLNSPHLKAASFAQHAPHRRNCRDRPMFWRWYSDRLVPIRLSSGEFVGVLSRRPRAMLSVQPIHLCERGLHSDPVVDV
jgi:hypothetical protein